MDEIKISTLRPDATNASASAPVALPDSLDEFLQLVHTGTPGLKAPTEATEIWPPLETKVSPKEILQKYMRQPELQDEKGGKPLHERFQRLMEQKGLYHPRSTANHVGAALGSAGLAVVPIVGWLYMSGRTNNVAPGHIAFYHTVSNKVRFVPAGWSYQPNPFHKNFETFDLNQDSFNYQGQVHVVRIKPGEIGVGLFGGRVRLLQPGANGVGVHVIVDPAFSLQGVHLITHGCIQASPINILNVPDGKVQPVVMDNRAHVLFPGHHVLECSNLERGALRRLDQCFTHETITHVVTQPGELVGLTIGKRSVFVDKPCSLWFKSDVSSMMANPARVDNDHVEFGPMARVIVSDYRMGVVQDEGGRLQVLSPGVHTIRQPSKHLCTVSGEWNHYRKEMEAYTADHLDVKLTMTFAYRVTDPIAFFKAGGEASFKTVHEMAESTMSEIILLMRIEDTLKRYTRSEEKKRKDEVEREGEGEANPVHMLKAQWTKNSIPQTKVLTEVLRRDFGIDMDPEVWGFQSFDLKDQKLQNQLSRSVIERSTARNERIKLQLKKETAEVKKETARIEAEQKRFEKELAAETERKIKLLKVNAEEKIKDAKLEGEHRRMAEKREYERKEAQAKADNEDYIIRKKAEAEAHAIRVKAAAESKLWENKGWRAIRLAELDQQKFQGMSPKLYIGEGQKELFSGVVRSLLGRVGKAHVDHDSDSEFDD